MGLSRFIWTWTRDATNRVNLHTLGNAHGNLHLANLVKLRRILIWSLLVVQEYIRMIKSPCHIHTKHAAKPEAPYQVVLVPPSPMCHKRRWLCPLQPKVVLKIPLFKKGFKFHSSKTSHFDMHDFSMRCFEKQPGCLFVSQYSSSSLNIIKHGYQMIHVYEL